MGHQIIRQPNGLYAVWSTIVDSFILLDATPEDIIQDWNVRDEKRNRERVMEIVGKLKRREKPYYQFTMTWAEAVRYIRKHKTGSADTLKLIEGLVSKDEAKRRLKKSPKNQGHNLWLHIPSGRAIPEKPEGAPIEDWRRITAWIHVEEDDE